MITPEPVDLSGLLRLALKIGNDPRGEAERMWQRFTTKLDQHHHADRRRPPTLW